jgi:hypothetical protein
VIPRWLQKRFNLWDQRVFIPNGTSLKYRHVRVPAASEPNKIFGQIENRISQGILDPAEIYLWALKIHVGFIYRDSSLKLDIKKNNGSPCVLNVGDYAQEILFFQLLYENWANCGTTTPSPLGSVFIVESLNPTPQFDLMHCLITGTVGINIGEYFILVFLWDQGEGLKSNILNQWEDFHLPRVKAMASDPDYKDYCYLAPHVWACESAYFAYRNRRSHSFIKTPKQVVLVPPLMRNPTREPYEEEYRVVCKSFGLELARYNDNIGNLYAPFKIKEKT